MSINEEAVEAGKLDTNHLERILKFTFEPDNGITHKFEPGVKLYIAPIMAVCVGRFVGVCPITGNHVVYRDWSQSYRAYPCGLLGARVKDKGFKPQFDAEKHTGGVEIGSNTCEPI